VTLRLLLTNKQTFLSKKSRFVNNLIRVISINRDIKWSTDRCFMEMNNNFIKCVERNDWFKNSKNNDILLTLSKIKCFNFGTFLKRRIYQFGSNKHFLWLFAQSFKNYWLTLSAVRFCVFIYRIHSWYQSYWWFILWTTEND
jgi:hypothetical protein